MAEVTTKPKNLIRLKDAIQRYSLSRSTFDRAANAGVITKHKVGRATFLDTYQIDAYILGESQEFEQTEIAYALPASDKTGGVQ